MKKIRTFLSNHKHFYFLLSFLPILIWFKYLEMTLVPKYIIHSVVDNFIPFVPIFVIPYVLWFPYMAYGVIFTGLYDKKEFCRLLIFLGGGMIISYVIYMIFPNALELRPVITKKDPLSLFVKFIYSVDTPTNVCPSIHVINSLAVNGALCHSPAFKRRKGAKTASTVLMTFICLSTMLIKQHSFVDVIGGLIVGILFYIPLYIIPELKIKGVENKRT